MIKTFRGLLADGGQDRLRLGTKQGKVGYKIIKFQIALGALTGSDQCSTVKIWKTEQTSVSTSGTTIDFTKEDLLASALAVWDNSQPALSGKSIIFDNEIFNQDIYVTNTDACSDNTSTNYYIELEVIPLSDMGAEYTTLKDIRTATSTI